MSKRGFTLNKWFPNREVIRILKNRGYEVCTLRKLLVKIGKEAEIERFTSCVLENKYAWKKYEWPEFAREFCLAYETKIFPPRGMIVGSTSWIDPELPGEINNTLKTILQDEFSKI